MNEQAIRPFYCGSQAADWREWNCDNCHQAGDCEIESALTAAYLDDGTVSPEIACRMGVLDNRPTEGETGCGPRRTTLLE